MNKQIIKHRKAIEVLHGKIKAIQDACPHEKVVGQYKANTGNWCPHDDSYWIEADCVECDKRIWADSQKDAELYRKLSLSGMIK